MLGGWVQVVFTELDMPNHYSNIASLIEQEKPLESLYCLSPAALAKQANRFLDGFPGVIAYAVKANPASELIEELAKCGVGTYDVASLAEIELVRGIMPEANLLYDNPVKSKHEIEVAYNDFAVRSFALDDEVEFEKLQSVIGDDSNVELTVRFKIPSNTAKYDLSAKFGADEAEAIALLQKVKAAGYRCGLTFHPGSQCADPNAYSEYIAKAADIVKGAAVAIETLNVGGGFPSRYLGEDLPKLEDYFMAIGNPFKQYFSDLNCTLVCEPGRALVDSSISLLCRVKHRRADQTVFLNDGVYGGFMEQFFSPIVHPTRVFRESKELTGDLGEFTVWGPTCDSLDRLDHKPRFPLAIAEGDWIEFALMGGYGSSTATKFNGFTSDRYVILDEGFPYDEGTLR